MSLYNTSRRWIPTLPCTPLFLILKEGWVTSRWATSWATSRWTTKMHHHHTRQHLHLSSIRCEQIYTFGSDNKIIILIWNNAPDRPNAWSHCGQRIIVSSAIYALWVISERSIKESLCQCLPTVDHSGGPFLSKSTKSRHLTIGKGRNWNTSDCF